MAATERSFSDLPPSRLYVDTNVFIGYLFSTDPLHSRCRALLERVVAQGSTTIFVSSISWMEFAHVVTRQRFRDALPTETQRTFQLGRWQAQPVRERYLQHHSRALEVLFSHFELEEVAVTPEVRAGAMTYMAAYDLDGQDAIHLARARLVGVRDVASFDRKFRRVDWLYLWNDLIYAGGPV